MAIDSIVFQNDMMLPIRILHTRLRFFESIYSLVLHVFCCGKDAR